MDVRDEPDARLDDLAEARAVLPGSTDDQLRQIDSIDVEI